MNAVKTHKKYIAVLLLSPFVLFSILVALIFLFEKKIPAPRLSSSESFNEKARWIRNNLTNGCDVLIVGSSMALNNIDGNSIKNAFLDKSVINTASWGLNVSETNKLLQYIIPVCHPKVIIYSIYYGDFDNQWEKTVNWSLFGEYISKKSTISTYVQSLDLKYYASTFISRKIAEKKFNKVYHSIFFDSTGSVMLDSENFEIDASRWSGHEKYKMLNKKNVNESLSNLKEIEEISNKINSQLIVIRTPLRDVADKTLAKPEIEELWMRVSKSVNDSGGVFLNIKSFTEFPDNQFTDFAHLNKYGANREIKFIIPVLRNILQE